MTQLKEQTTLRIVLYEGNGSQPLEAAERYAALSTLLEKGFAVTRAGSDGQVAPADRSSLLVLGKFNHGITPQGIDANGAVSLRFQDISGYEPARIAEIVESVRAETNAARHGEWKPWFPV